LTSFRSESLKRAVAPLPDGRGSVSQWGRSRQQAGFGIFRKPTRSVTQRFVLAGLLLVGAGLTLGALSPWAENVVAGSPVEAALYRLMSLPGGNVMWLRPPAEAKDQLGAITGGPQQSDLFASRAHEEERMLDIAGAESDWNRAAEYSTDKAAAFLDLAHFYQRRVEPQKELQGLLWAAREPNKPSERFAAPSATVSYAAFQEALQLCVDAQLGVDAQMRVYQAWIDRWPKGSEIQARYFEYLITQKRTADAQALLSRHTQQFPDDQEFTVIAAAELAGLTGGPQQELAAYDKQFSPLWPASLATRYYNLLESRHQLRRFLADARTQAAAQPTALAPALRIFFYYDQQQKPELAEVALLELEGRREAAKTSWSAGELQTIGPLFERVHDNDEVAKVWYSLYALPNGGAARSEGLAKLAGLLLLAPEQKLRLGGRDLSLYKNVGQMDHHPGFLNGILSVVLSPSSTEQEYSSESETAVAYFHRAAASELIDRLKKETPNSPAIADLEAKLIAAYAVYGQDDAIITRGPAYLTQYPNSPAFLDTAMLLADSYMRKKNQPAEFALYNRLLNELAAKADHVPIGANNPQGAVTPPPPAAGQSNEDQEAVAPATQPNLAAIKQQATPATPGVRSPDYARVLDRYISRLIELHRLNDALALYRREIDQNPQDPGLYERLATFLDQNKLDDQLEKTYREAMKKFNDTSWSDKLARFYLRRDQLQSYESLTKQVVDTFSGSDLERYFRDVPPGPNVTAVLFLRVNQYAHQRFPHNLTFVRNLLFAYQRHGTAGTSGTYDPVAYEKLLRENWFAAPDLRTQFFALLTKSGRLARELAALPKAQDATAAGNMAALEFAAEGHAWLTHYETAAPAYASLAKLAPGDDSDTSRAISIHRSLADSVPGAFTTAITLAEGSVNANPSDHAALTRVGEIFADREEYAKAAPYWNRLAVTSPGTPDGYLEAATVFWDYFQYSDALRLIRQGRTALNNSSLYAYEAGAIYENESDMPVAVEQYIKAVLETPTTGSNGLAQARLIKLARRKPTHDLIEQKTIAALSSGGLKALDLRVALLENQGRQKDLQQLLDAEVRRATSPEALASLRATATRLRLNSTIELALERTVAVTTDPVEKLQAGLELASFREGRKDLTGAQTELSTLLRENPTLLGVIRANVDFYDRTNQLPQAVAVLEAAAPRAVQPYRNSLLREASADAADAGNFVESRKILDQLLADDPFNGDLLAAKAFTYARQGDDQALASFYQQTLETMAQAPLPQQEKTARVAALRRGYEGALTKLGHYQDALDQYIEILNRFPDDPTLANEVANYAEAHSLADRLTGYYEKTAQASPKDYRWPLVLGRVDRALRRYPEAIVAFTQASHIRPDRPDLLIDKVDLETRLLHFDDAIKTNQQLYELTYHNSQYLDAQAELQARLGKKAEALKLLRQAHIDGHPKLFGNYSEVATRLTQWAMWEEAKQVYEEGLPLIAGHEADYTTGFGQYLQTLTVLRQYQAALTRAAAADNTPKRTALQEWTTVVGQTIQTYYSPEEKSKVAQSLATPGSFPAKINVISFVRAAGLNDILAQRLYARATARPNDAGVRGELSNLETRQMRFGALGQQLEALAKLQGSAPSTMVETLSMALNAYHAGGNDAAELRLYDQIYGEAQFNAERYAELIANDPSKYAARIKNNTAGLAVAGYLVSNTDENRAFQAIDALKEPADLWHPAYTALVGVYYLSKQPRVPQSFQQLMGPRTVGEQAVHPTAIGLTGDTWFYYGSRFGEYLGVEKQATADDYLASGVESSPAASQRYLQLGDTLRDLKRLDQARIEYSYAQQISPELPEVTDRLASIDWESGRKQQAAAEWKQVFDLLRQRVLNGKMTPSFWTTARNALIEANRNHIVADIKPEADALFKQYIRINGGYQFLPFMQGILTDAPDRSTAVAWIVELTRDDKTSGVLDELVNSPLLRGSEKDAIYRELIARSRQSTTSDDPNSSAYALMQRQTEYARYLDQQKRYAEAWQVLSEMQTPSNDTQATIDLRIHTGALSGHLDTLLAESSKNPAQAPLPQIEQAAQRLAAEGHQAQADPLLEFVYQTQLAGPYAPASAYFGLARLRLEQKRNDEALVLLRDVTLSVGVPFENLAQAGKLLEDAGLLKEAGEYYAQWHTAVPWDPTAAVGAARLAKATPELDNDRKNMAVPYPERVVAATAMRNLHASAQGTSELDVLTQPQITPALAEKPYVVDARLAAAAQSKDPAIQVRLLEQAVAINPEVVEARIKLVPAALRAKRDRTAINAYESVYGDGSQMRRGRDYGEQVPYVAPLTPEELQLREDIATAYRRLNQYGAADQLYAVILAAEPPAAVQARIEKARKEVSEQLRLNAANRLRAPSVSKEIQQPRPVRPKLSVPPPLDPDEAESPEGNEGGVQ
jgi:cellulose synthase operon protein C